jgi:hypothetical protein
MAQSQSFFKPIKGNLTPPESAKSRTWMPTQASAWELPVETLSAAIQAAPMEFTNAAYYGNTHTLDVPLPDGSTERFTMFRVKTLAQGIYDNNPEIRTFAGRSLAHPHTTIRGSVTVRGLRIMILHEDKTAGFVEPYFDGQTQYYIAYHQSGVDPSIRIKIPKGGSAPEVQGYSAPELPVVAQPVVAERGLAELVQLKTYRFALACTGEFGQDQGGTAETAFAGLVEYANWVNGIFERDLAIRLELVEKSKDMAFFNPTTDPYPNPLTEAVFAQNGLVVNGFVGNDNYDVGHVIGRYFGGPGGIGSDGGTCISTSKASGASMGQQGVYGNEFVSTICQEIGHQLSGGHTWNRCSSIGGRQGFGAFEPGSGSAIMSYSGSCGNDNVQTYSDLYYNAGTVERIVDFYMQFNGATCGTLTETTNHKPEVTLNYGTDFFIPIETPFELKGSATDMDGDSLSYNWEQINTGPECPLETPVGNAPIFRSRPPSATGTNRYFPRLSTILANGFDITEQLPTYTRDLDFRFSARDNRPSDGGLSWADVSFKATETAGPFAILSPNTPTWKVGEFATVTWDVANTFGPPVNCKKVNIRLSTDGGLTWPITLASGVSNDGEHLVSVPNNVTTKARIRVDAADNVFFDISDNNFKIEAPTAPSFSAAMSENSADLCLPNSFQADVLTAAVLGFNNLATISIVPGNLPASATVALSNNTVQPGQSATLTVNMENVTVAGTYTFNVKVTANGAPDVVFPITLTTFTNDFSTMALSTPTDGSTNMVQSQVLRWSKATDAVSYNLQVATNPSFGLGTIVATKTNTPLDTFKIPFLLSKNQAYFWRIQPNNVCSPHAWTEPYFFSTLSESCSTFESPDLPKNLSAGAVTTIESKIELLGNTVITDINVKQLKGFHGEFSDFDAKLISPAGTEITLFKNRCAGYNGVFNFGLDDSAPNAFACPPNNTGGGYVRPQTQLGAFIGQNAQGQWILRIKDQVTGEGGTVEAFQLDVCQSLEVNPPVVVTNNALAINNGENGLVGQDLLLVNDPDNTAEQLKFTLLTLPYFGELRKSGIILQQGDAFTQADINNGSIRYYNYGHGEPSDYFRFVVTDGSGGYLGTPVFLIQIAVDAPEAPAAQYAFRLVPNPATETAWLTFDQPTATDLGMVLYTSTGQMAAQAVVPAGSTRFQVSVATLPRGVYFAQINGPEGMRMEKMILR